MLQTSIRALGHPDTGLAARARALMSWRRLTGPAGLMIGTTVANNLLRIVSTVVMTRLLSPSAYGLVGIIMSVFFVIVMLTDTGVQAFVVRHVRGLEREFLDAVWTIHIIRGVLIAAVAVALAWPISGLLAKPELAPLLAVASLSLAIDGTMSMSLITAPRLNMVRKLSLLDFAVSFIQTATGLAAAWMLRSVWAIVIAIIVASAVRSLASYLIFPDARRRFRLDRAIASELWSFSRLIAASSTLTLIMSQVDRVVLARIFSLQQFGVYSVAGGLAATPTALVHMYTSRIMYPAFAETWRTAPERLRQRYYELRGNVFYGYLFAVGGLIGSAPLVVTILYDPRYAGVSFYLRLLAVSSALLMITKSQNELLVASSRVRMTLEANGVRLAWLLFGALAGYLTLGANGVVVALAFTEVAAYLYGSYRLIDVGLYSPRHELVAFGAIGSGVLLGWAGAVAVPLIIPVS